MVIVLVVFLYTYLLLVPESFQTSYSSYSLTESEFDRLPVNIYFIPHSHCDPGWLYTYEKYYTNSVYSILDNVFLQLSSSPLKRFAWSETSFLQPYYESLSESDQAQFQEFLRNGQLEIVGGGWVQHDETLTTYQMQLTQMEIGHNWLLQTFPFLKDKIKVLWQLDQFGSSSITPLLFGSKQGNIKFKYAVINRIGDYQKNIKKDNQDMDFYWVNSLNEEAKILTHTLYYHYDTMEYELIKKYFKPKIQSNKRKEFLQFYNEGVIQPMLQSQKHRNIMLLFGNDFAYSKDKKADFGKGDFEKLDQIVEVLNQESERVLGFKINAKIATPSEYFEQVESEQICDLQILDQDFSHYDEVFQYLHPTFDGLSKIDYWTSYYTNHPQFKSLIYSLTNVYITTLTFTNLIQLKLEQDHYLLNEYDKIRNQTLELELGHMRGNLSILQQQIGEVVSFGSHHDTIPSTSRQGVHENETAKFYNVLDQMNSLLQSYSVKVLEGNYPNETITNSTQYVIFNRHLYQSEEVIVLRADSKYLSVKVNNESVYSEIIPVYACQGLMTYKSKELQNLQFMLKLEPLSLNNIEIEVKSQKECEGNQFCAKIIQDQVISRDQNLTFESQSLKISLNNKTFLIKEIYNKQKNRTISLDMNLVRYIGQFSESGAYILAPMYKAQELKITPLNQVYFESQINSQIMIFYKNAYKKDCFGIVIIYLVQKGVHASTIGFQIKTTSLDFDDLYLRLNTNLKNTKLYTHNSLYYIDNSEIKNQKRYVSNRDLGVNYYPSTLSSLLRYEDKCFSIFSGDRPTGVGSIKDGQIDIGIGRKSKFNDDKGLPEGVQDKNIFKFHATFGLFDVKEIYSDQYEQHINEQYAPSVILELNSNYKFNVQQIQFGSLIETFNNKQFRPSLGYITYNQVNSQYQMKMIFKFLADGQCTLCNFDMKSDYFHLEETQTQIGNFTFTNMNISEYNSLDREMGLESISVRDINMLRYTTKAYENLVVREVEDL